MLPTAGREQSAVCCCCPRAKPKLPAGDEEGRDICKEHREDLARPRVPFVPPFSSVLPVCVMGSTDKGKVGARTCRQAPLPTDFFLKTGMEGQGLSLSLCSQPSPGC